MWGPSPVGWTPEKTRAMGQILPMGSRHAASADSCVSGRQRTPTISSQRVDPDVAAFAERFQRFLQSMEEGASRDVGPSPLKEALDRHLGADASGVPVISDSFPAYDQ